jgi:hypothetical protein
MSFEAKKGKCKASRGRHHAIFEQVLPGIDKWKDSFRVTCSGRFLPGKAGQKPAFIQACSLISKQFARMGEVALVKHSFASSSQDL